MATERSKTHIRAAASVLLLGFAGCDEVVDEPKQEPTPLGAFVFPNTLEPAGQATVAISVQKSECKAHDACTVCVGLSSKGSGSLFPPAGIDVESGRSIALPAEKSELLQSIVYVAPNHEGSEVISVSAFRGSFLDCAGKLSLEDLLATTTVRVVIRKPSPVQQTDDSGEGGSAPSVGGSSNEGGSPGSAGEAGSGPAGSGGNAG